MSSATWSWTRRSLRPGCSRKRTIRRPPGDMGEEPFNPLSPREMEILQLITNGMSNKEIATQLGISHQTVKNHITAILHKLGVKDRTQAAVYTLRRGWVRLQDTQPAERHAQSSRKETAQIDQATRLNRPRSHRCSN